MENNDIFIGHFDIEVLYNQTKDNGFWLYNYKKWSNSIDITNYFDSDKYRFISAYILEKITDICFNLKVDNNTLLIYPRTILLLLKNKPFNISSEVIIRLNKHILRNKNNNLTEEELIQSFVNKF